MLNKRDASKTERNVIDFADAAPSNEGGSNCDAALALMSQAVDIMRNVESRAAAKQDELDQLASRAIDELRTARARAEFAEAKQRAVEAEIKILVGKTQAIEKAMDKAAYLMADADARVVAAMRRADLAEKALMRIDAFMARP